MNVNAINTELAIGRARPADFLPHLQDLRRSPHQFRFSFGLDVLPRESGIILIRGPRQYGKSTWLEQQIETTAREFGPGTVFYLNGDEVVSATELADAAQALIGLFRRDAAVRRLFIDEITVPSASTASTPSTCSRIMP
mgnify:CR=1 FL=1